MLISRYLEIQRCVALEIQLSSLIRLAERPLTWRTSELSSRTISSTDNSRFRPSVAASVRSSIAGNLRDCVRLRRTYAYYERNFPQCNLRRPTSAQCRDFTGPGVMIREIGTRSQCAVLSGTLVRDTLVLPARLPACHRKSRRCSYANPLLLRRLACLSGIPPQRQRQVDTFPLLHTSFSILEIRSRKFPKRRKKSS